MSTPPTKAGTPPSALAMSIAIPGMPMGESGCSPKSNAVSTSATPNSVSPAPSAKRSQMVFAAARRDGRVSPATRPPKGAFILLYCAALERGGGEGVAILRAAGIHAALEPAHALRRSAVRKRVRHDAALRLLMKTIIADRRGCIQRFFHLAGIELVHDAGL